MNGKDPELRPCFVCGRPTDSEDEVCDSCDERVAVFPDVDPDARIEGRFRGEGKT